MADTSSASGETCRKLKYMLPVFCAVCCVNGSCSVRLILSDVLFNPGNPPLCGVLLARP